MRSIRRFVRPEKFVYAKQMRHAPTLAERALWERLNQFRKRRDGYKFRRQSVILGFIVDFYCPVIRLVVEVDGGYHADRKSYDEKRSNRLKSAGFTVIRFTNEDVLGNLESTVGEICAVCVGMLDLKRQPPSLLDQLQEGQQ